MIRRNSLPRFSLAVVFIAGLLLGPPVAAQDLLATFEAKTTVHVLENGWTFVICERPVAPVFSFATLVDVGSAQEVPGITGLAHMFEHMAFKGTPKIGTKDYAAEKEVLAEVEAAYLAYETARRNPTVEPERVEELLAAFKAKQEEAGEFVLGMDFIRIVEKNGGTGVNAFTNADFTGYFYSLPANRFELFAHLESERFLHPVFREFYKERDVVQEERRMRSESQPFGRLIEQAVATAFVAHPYKQPVVGYMSDLQSFTATDAEAFFRKHYVPANMVTAIVGHVEAEKIIPLLDKYFGRIPKGPEPPPLRTVEPAPIAEKEVVLIDPSQPIYMEMYHKPSATHPDQAVYDAIDDVLSNGRTSRLYRRLVRDEQIAVAAGSLSNFPGAKYPGLWLAYAFAAKDHGNEELQAAIREELERLVEEPVSDAEIERFKTRAKADLLRQLDSNFGLAFQLSNYQILHGDWRELFHAIDKIEAVSAEDIKRVAGQTFRPTHRTVAMIVNEETAAAELAREGSETDGETSEELEEASEELEAQAAGG